MYVQDYISHVTKDIIFRLLGRFRAVKEKVVISCALAYRLEAIGYIVWVRI